MPPEQKQQNTPNNSIPVREGLNAPELSNMIETESSQTALENQALDALSFARADEASLEPSITEVQQTVPLTADDIPKAASQYRFWALRGGVAALVLLLIGLGGFAGKKALDYRNNLAKQGSLATSYGTSASPLNDLANQSANGLAVVTDSSARLTVNGTLDINGALVINQSGTPTNPVKGQIYYSNVDNKLYFYDGIRYIDITYASTVPTSVSSVQGLTGAITFTGGSGIEISGTTISSTVSAGVKSIASGSANLTISSDGNGGYTISDANAGIGVELQNSSPGSAQTGNINITGTMIAGSFEGDGSGLTNLNASNVASGTLADARLSTNVTLAGNTFNGVNQLVQLDGSGFLPALNGSALTSLNASNITTGTLADARLSTNVTLQGNIFNGANQLVKLNPSGDLPAISGINLTNLNASAITAGTLPDARLSANVTVMGNTFNGPNQLLQLTNLAYLPVINGSNVTALDASNISSGTLADARLSANVALLNGNQTFSGSNTFSSAINVNTITPSGALTVGATGQAFTLQGNGSSAITATSGGFTNTIGFTGVPIGNVAYNFDRSVTAGTYTICTTYGNCAGTGGGVTTPGGSTNKLARFTGSQTIGDSAISDTGAVVTIQNSSDSINGFQIQDSAGTSNLFIADTTNTRIGIGMTSPAYTLDVDGDINSATGLRVAGNLVCDASGCIAGGGSGFYIQNSTALQTAANFDIESADAGEAAGVVRGTTGQTADIFQVWQGASLTGRFMPSGNLSITGNYLIGGSQISSSNLSDYSNIAHLNGIQTFTAANTFTGAILQQNALDSTIAFRIQNSAGTSNLFVADTTNTRVGIGTANPGYTLDVNGDINISSGNSYRINGVAICGAAASCAPASGSNFYIQNSTAQQNNANFNIMSANSASVGGIIRGATGQTADLFRLQDENGANVATFGSAGRLTLGQNAAAGGALNFRHLTDIGDITVIPGSVGVSSFTLVLPGENGTLCSTGSICAGYAASSGSGNYIQNGTSVQVSANFAIQSAATGSITATFKAITSQTADIIQVQNSSGVALSGIDASGNMYLGAGQSLKVTGGASFPSSPTEGQVYYRTDTKQLYVYANAKWQADRTTATKIVAANDSQNKEKADYVATGTSDQTTINAAISALPGTGGVVILLDGTFNVTGAVTLAANVTLGGAGPSTILKIPNSTNSTFNVISATSVNNVKIQDLVVDGNRANQSSGTNSCVYLSTVGSAAGASAVPGAFIRDITTKNCTDRGIYSVTLLNSTITNIQAINNGSDGIMVWNGARVAVTSNVVQGNVSNGINDITSTAISIIGNQISTHAFGIASSGTNDVITDNTVTSNTNGMSLSGTAIVASNNNISSNTTGVVLAGTDNIATGNSLSSNGDAFTMQGATRGVISNNRIQNTTGRGVVPWLAGSGGTISGNYFSNGGGSGASSAISILSGGPSGLIITDNTITDTAGSGFAILIPSGISNTYLSGNVYSGTGATSISDSGTGTIYANQHDSSGNIVFRGQAGTALNGTTTTYALQNTGAFVQGGVSTPSAPTVAAQGTTGATSWSYTVTATDGLGETVASTATNITNGNATLNSSNFNRITPTRTNGAVSYKVYRTVAGGTPSSTGLIGTVAGGAANFYLDDTGLAGSGTSPTSNNTGVLAINSTGTPGAVEKLRVNTPTTVDVLANVIFSTSATTSKGLVIQGVASQTANLQEWQSSAGAVMAAHDASGNLVFGASNASSTGVIRLQNATSIGWRNAANTADKVINFGSTSVADSLNLPGSVVLGGSDATAGALYFFGSTVGIRRGGPSSLQLFTGATAIDINSLGKVAIAPSANWASGSDTGGTVEKLRVSTPVTIDNLANTILTASAATSKPLVVQGFTSQSANLQEWQSSAGTVLSSVNSSGLFNIGTASNSIAANAKLYVSGTAVNATTETANNWSLNGVTRGTQLFTSETAASGSPASMSLSGFGYSGGTIPTLGTYGYVGSYSGAWGSGTRTIIGAYNDARSSTGLSADTLVGTRSSASFDVDATTGSGVAYGTYASASTNTASGGIGRTAYGVYGLGISSGANTTVYGGFFTTSGTGTNVALQATTGAAGAVGLVVKGVTSQASALQDWQSSTGTSLASVSAAGMMSATGFTSLASSAISTGGAVQAGTVRIGTIPASTGDLRLTNANTITYRNAANSGDITVATVDSSNFTRIGGAGQAGIILGTSGGGTGSTQIFGASSVTITKGASSTWIGAAPTTTDALADTIFGTTATTQKGIVVQGKASQTANLQEWQSSTGAILSSVDAAGRHGIGVTPTYSLDVSSVSSLTNTTGTRIVLADSAAATTDYALYADNQHVSYAGGTHYGVYGKAVASSGGGAIAIGTYGLGVGGQVTYGLYGLADANGNANRQYTGVFGSAGLNASTNSTLYGGYFELTRGGNNAASSAIVANANFGSAAATDYLLNLRNNGTNVLTVGATGAIQGGDSGGAVVINGGTAGASTAGGAITLQAAAGGATTGAGGAVSITSGAGTTSGAGGAMTLTTGAGAGSSNGGAFTLQTGAGGATFGNGGAINLTAGNGTASNTNGGAIAITAGTSVGNQVGGALTIAAGGSAGAVGGTLTLRGGNSTGSTGGGVSILGGTTASGIGGGITLTAANGVGNAGGAVAITSGSATSGNVAGGAMTLQTGVGFGNAAGGALTLQAGAAGAGGAAGGAVSILAGAGGGTSGAGGAISLTAGAGTATNTAGGALTLTTGAGIGNAAGGLLTLQGGAAGATGTGAGITLTSGAGGATSGNSGAVTIQSGNVTSGTAGNVTLDVGTSSTGNGSILIGSAARAVTIGIGVANANVTQTINIGTNTGGASITNVTIGGGISSGAISIQNGTGGLLLGTTNGVAQTIQIGANSNSAQTIRVGASSGGASAVTAEIGSPFGTSSLKLSSGTGGINIGNDNQANTIQIGNASSVSAQTINLGNNSGGTPTTTVNIGSPVGASITNIKAGSGLVNVSTTGADATTVAQFNNAGGTTCTVQPGGTGFSCSSDARLKTNVATVVNPQDIIRQLRGVTFNWTSSPDGQSHAGFIAQELEQLIPSAVSTDSRGYKVANYTEIIPYLVGTAQAQDLQITGIAQAQTSLQQTQTDTTDALTTVDGRVQTLEQKVAALEAAQPQGSGNSFNSLNVSGTATIQNLTVTGSATIATLTVTGDATFAGNILVNGHIIGNDDTRGTVMIPAGQTEIKHTFTKPYEAGTEPNVVITAKSGFAPSYRVESDETSFTVFFQTPAAADTVMNYQVQQ